MNKTYHFMAGLPRSGSTVLSALLNQHTQIYASPQTDLLGMLYKLDCEIPQFESYKAGLFYEGYLSVVNSVKDSFYSHIDKPVIIDKNRGWGTPYNFNELSDYVNPEGKVILTMRPILEVIASFVMLAKKTEKTNGSLPYFNPNLWASTYRNKEDAIVENLMMPNGEIDRAIFSVANLLKNHKDRVHLVWFDDLVNKPQSTLEGIYSFLELENYENNFENIVAVDNHDDLSGYGVANLHDIKSKLQNSKTNPDDVLSNFVIAKYKNTLDFLDL
jgi:sulfotransferase